MTVVADMGNPFTRWQRLVSRILPWYDLDEQAAHDRRTDEVVEQAGRIDSIRIAYRDTGNRLERRQTPR